MSSRITTEGPALDERTLNTDDGPLVHLTKLPDDPLCLRVSLGGTRDGGFYFVFRGDAEAIHNLLCNAMDAFEQYRRGDA